MPDTVRSKADEQVIRAIKLVSQGSYPEAETLLQAVVSEHPEHGRAWHELGNVLYRRGFYADAAIAYERRLILEPENPNANVSFALTLEKLGRQEEAQKYLARAAELRPVKSAVKEKTIPSHPKELAEPPKIVAQAPPSPPSAMAGESSEAAVNLLDEIKKGVIDPGRLQREAQRSFKSFLGSFVLAGMLALTGIGAVAFGPPGWEWFPLISDERDHIELMQRITTPVSAAEIEDSLESIESLKRKFDAGFLISAFGLTVLAFLVFINALGSASATRYRIYERRVDIERGVLKRVVDSIWLYEVTDIKFERPFALLFTGTAQFAISTDRTDRRGNQPEKPYLIIGFAPMEEMRVVWEDLTNKSFAQRQNIKGIST